MRIVHEIQDRCRVLGSGDPCNVADGAPVPDNFTVEISITSPPGLARPPDAFGFEGSAKDVRDALLRAVVVIDKMGAMFVEKGKLAPDWDQSDLAVTRKA